MRKLSMADNCTMRRAIIYQLVDPTTYRIRYVGQTVKGLKERLRVHCSTKGNRHVVCWIKSLRAQGLEPIIQEVVQVSEVEADTVEKILIAFYRSVGHPLTNHHEGGQKNRIVDKATCEKIAAAHRGKKRGPHPPETLAKMSAAKRGKKLSKETRQKLSRANMGKTLPLEQRMKMSNAHLGVSRPPDVGAKISSGLKRSASNRTRSLIIDGVAHYAAEWAEIVGINHRTISYRLGIGWSEKDAVMTPVRGKR